MQGTDILDTSCEENPLFCVPYCSSNLWLGTEAGGTRNNTAADGECTQCFDYSKLKQLCVEVCLHSYNNSCSCSS